MQLNLHKILKNNPQADPDARVVNQFEQRLLAEAVKQQQAHRSKLYRWITRGSSLAACVAVLLFVFIPHNSDSFAAMQETIRQSDYLAVQIRIELSVPMTNKTIPLSQTQSWISRTQGIRSDISIFGRPALQLWHPWVGDTLLINHIHQVTLPIRLPVTIDPRQLRRFNPANLIEQISRLSGKPQRIESENLDMVGYQINSQALQLPANARVEVWADRGSNRPRRIHCEIPLPNGSRMLWVVDHFAWGHDDVPAQFKPTNPKSYKQAQPLQIPDPSLRAVAKSFRNFAKQTGGTFPSSQTLPWQGATAVIVQAMRQSDLKDTQINKKSVAGLAQALAGGIYLLQAYEQGKQITYHGDVVRLGDSQELLRITSSDGSMKTIDGKLNIKAIEP